MLVVAATLPQLYPIWMRREVDTLGLVRERLGVWLFDSRLFLASAIGTAVGAGLLFGGVDGPGAPLADTSLLLLGIGTALWCVNITFRVSTTAAAARDFTDTPPWYPYLVRSGRTARRPNVTPAPRARGAELAIRSARC